ncbi:hypothetical protein ScPMuIL_011579 [Solemya velum]
MATGVLYSVLFLFLCNSFLHKCYGQESVIVRYNIEEEQNKFTYVGNVAERSKLHDNVSSIIIPKLKYQILTEGNHGASKFLINESSSIIHTAEKIDRESVCPDTAYCVVTFSVAVFKHDPNVQPVLFQIIGIEIVIQDINDNAPEFPEKEIVLFVKESDPVDTELPMNGAIDLDTGDNNSVQNYEIIPSDGIFGLKVWESFGRMELAVIVKDPLNREQKDFYQFTVVAKDGGNMVGTVLVNITVIDDNDNIPKFTKQLYNVTVSEDTPINTTILQLSATDLDIGANGEITYDFSSRVTEQVMNTLSIDTTSGRVTIIKLLDYEESSKLEFIVRARDNGERPHSSSAMVVINIADANDNAPQININFPPGGADFAESVSVDSLVATVTVFDKDHGVNKKVSCEVFGTHFAIRQFSYSVYEVIVKSKLDYELARSHNVTVHCWDSGLPSQHSTSTFIINVLDVNDNRPIFTKTTYTASFLENSRKGTKVTQLYATDRDSGVNGEIQYSLHQEAFSLFSIDHSSGIITTSSEFDREKMPSFRFRVIASDKGSPPESSTATVIVTVEDENDNKPAFSSSVLTLHVLENQRNGTPAGNLTAFDKDTGENAKLTYTFASRDGKNPDFTLIQSTGQLLTKHTFDREIQNLYNFTVRVTDKGRLPLTSTATVVVKILDDNDNIPFITFPNNSQNTVLIPYFVSTGTYITQIEAHDVDEDANAKLLYYIHSGNDKELFDIDLNVGTVRVAKKMETQDTGTYHLEIAVRDGGILIQRTSWTSLNIHVGNGTKTPEDEQNYMLIVVTVVTVTVVLSAAIIVTICIIRRVDRERRMREEMKHEEKMFSEKNGSCMSPLSKSSDDSEVDKLKEKNKKEVSFSLDDESDSANNSTLTNVTSFSTFKGQPSYIAALDPKMLEHPQACSSVIGNNTLMSDLRKCENYRDKQPEIDFLTAQRLQQALLQQHEQRREENRHLMEILKKHDDANSESSGETGTSDSGRGGSEEDINSNKAHTMSDTDEPRHYYTENLHLAMPQVVVPQQLHRGNWKNMENLTHCDQYQRNISFSDDSVTANTTVNNSNNHSSHHNNHRRRPPSPPSHIVDYSHSATNIHSLYRTGDNSDVFTISGRTFRDSMGIPYSLADIDDVSESVTTRDDISTTTSGSYTINPDDLVNEIDELFFNDVIV